MTEYKKLIAGFGIQEGMVFSWDGKRAYGAGLTELSEKACDGGADEILIYDRAVTDEDHEASIGAIRRMAREVDAPVFAGGCIKRLEDVKKYLYAGASAVFLNAGCREQADLIKEASERFGSEKIGLWLPGPSWLSRGAEYKALGASFFIVNTGSFAPSFQELEALEENGGSCLIAAGLVQEAGQLAESLRHTFSCDFIDGAVLTLAETRTDEVMEVKQKLKDRGIPVSVFESSLSWEAFKTDEKGLVPVIVQDYKTQEVLMLAYMNEEAFLKTLATGRMTYFSRSRQTLWLKGETSGHFQYVKSLKIDCDQDTILAEVKQVGAACHTGNHSCFYTSLAEKEYRESNPLKVFEDVYQVILDRKANPKEGSYTNYLFDKGLDKILKKLGEEATEIVIAAKNPDTEEVKYEMADFLYHMMVLMAQRGLSWEEITQELANR